MVFDLTFYPERLESQSKGEKTQILTQFPLQTSTKYLSLSSSWNPGLDNLGQIGLK